MLSVKARGWKFYRTLLMTARSWDWAGVPERLDPAKNRIFWEIFWLYF